MKRRNLILGLGGLALAGGTGALGWRGSVGSAAAYAEYQAQLRRPLDAADDRDLIRYASLAANGHNTQPWRFHLGDGVIEIRPDFTRRTPVVDPDDHHLFVSLGCAAETLAIAAAATGRSGEISIAADGSSIRYAFTSGSAPADPLFDAIPRRQSTRAVYDGRPVSGEDLRRLETAAAIDGVDVSLITERARIGSIRDLVIAGNAAQMADPAFMRELKDWIRFSRTEAMARGDGLFAPASGNPALPTPLGRLAFDLFFDVEAENDKYAQQIESSAGLAVFLGERPDPAHWIAVGRSGQRFALAATSLGLKTAFLNQPVEVAALRPELARLVGATGRRPDLLLRFGFGPALPFSPRRAPAETTA